MYKLCGLHSPGGRDYKFRPNGNGFIIHSRLEKAKYTPYYYHNLTYTLNVFLNLTINQLFLRESNTLLSVYSHYCYSHEL